MKYLRGKKAIIVVFIIISLLISSNIIKVFATTSSELKKQQQENQSQIEATKKEQEKIRAQMSDIQKEVDSLNSQISDYESEIYDLTDKIDEISTSIKNAETEIEKTQKDLEEKQELLEKRLVYSYMAGDSSYIDLLLNSDSLSTFLSNYYLIEELVEYDTDLINTVSDTKKQLEESKKQLEDNKANLEQIKEKQESKKAELDSVKKQKTDAVAELSEEEKELEKKVDEMRAEDTRIKNAIKKAEEEERKRLAAGGKSTQSNPGGFIYPVPQQYSKITTGLYYQTRKTYHGAVDFGTAGINGQPVYAVKSGTVVLTARLNYSYGNYVIINHHDGTYTLYAHGQAGSICVSEGQEVSQGQQIMRVGSTGNSTGPHLHFEVRVAPYGYANRVNPMNYLP